MPRKRKVPVIGEEKANHNSLRKSKSLSDPMYKIMSHVQLNETYHKKYIREMQQLHAKMEHSEFMSNFTSMIKSAMVAEEWNDYANTTLLFCANFTASYDTDNTHPVLADTCHWLLTTFSNNSHIRFRICQFVNMILNALGVEASLDDSLCDKILEYMVHRLRDLNQNVRVQAILALQRLQCPDNPDDIVLRVYQFHLCADPSPKVRTAVITSMGRNYNTIPYILERLWDVDEKVRRHTYFHMSGYPVKAYKVSQRLQLLEQGLSDRSELVKKVVTTIMLPQWLESYNKNYITFVSALKLDANEAEFERFQKIAKIALREIFKKQRRNEIIACLPLEEEGQFYKCVPHEKLTVEATLYWQCLVEHLQAEMADELDNIIPELSTFCAYVLKFCESQSPMGEDKFAQLEFQYILLLLFEILHLYDLGDEVGRENFKNLISIILKTNYLEEQVIEVIVKCTENLITDHNSRLQFFVEIIEQITHTGSFENNLLKNRRLIEELLEKSSADDLKLKLSSLKVKILDLEEEETNCLEMKDYEQAQRISEEKNVYTEEYATLLKPLLEQYAMESNNASGLDVTFLEQAKKVSPETIVQSLQLAYYMVVSKNVKALTPNVCNLYNKFISRYVASNQITIRDWALKCGTAYSMLYESLAKEIYQELYAQFYKNHNIRIWKTSITCIFELLDRYGCTSFHDEERQNKTKRNVRQLYNTLEFIDADEDSSACPSGQGIDIIFMMSHVLDTCDDVCIISAIVNGFCRLVLHDHIKSAEIIEKLLILYFNPSTDSEINQILGVFLENVVQRKKQDCLYPCLIPTVIKIIGAPYESPLHEIKPETVLRFVIDATRPQYCAPPADIHRKLATSFLQEMQNNLVNKELCKVLSTELLTLDTSVLDFVPVKAELKCMIEKLIKCDLDAKIIKNLISFKEILDGVFKPSPRQITLDGSEDDKSDEETSSGIHLEPSNTAESRLQLAIEETNELIVENGLRTQSRSDESDKENESRCDSQNDNESANENPIEEPNQIDKEESTPPNQPLQNISSPQKNTEELALQTPPRLVRSNLISDIQTTLGNENTIDLRFLRKSINFTRQPINDDGPSPKIRIEARIDSLPATPTTTKTPEEKISQAKTNLRSTTKAVVDKGNNDLPKSKKKSISNSEKSTRVTRANSLISKGKTPKLREQKQQDANDGSDAIPPSPTSSVISEATSTRSLTRRLNRALTLNKTVPTIVSKTRRKSTRSSLSNGTSEKAESNTSKDLSSRRLRKRPMSPNLKNNSKEESVKPLSNSITETPKTNRLRPRNTNTIEKSAQPRRSTHSIGNKTISPSSKENKPKSPSDSNSSSSGESNSPTGERIMETPENSKQTNYLLTNGLDKKLRNESSSDNLKRVIISRSEARVSTRSSVRRNDSSKMIMTRKRLSLQKVHNTLKNKLSNPKVILQRKLLSSISVSNSTKTSKIPVSLRSVRQSTVANDKVKTNSINSGDKNSAQQSSSKLQSTSAVKSSKEQSKEATKTGNTLLSNRNLRMGRGPLVRLPRIAQSAEATNTKTSFSKRKM